MNYPEVWRRDDASTKVYYFMYSDPATGKRKRKSTGCTKKKDAREFVQQFFDELNSDKSKLTFREYAGPYYIWDRCPRIANILAEGGQIGKQHCAESRRYLEEHVFTHPLAKKKIAKITHGEILDLRKDLLDKGLGPATVRRVISGVRAVFNDAFKRGDLEHNPAVGIADVKSKKNNETEKQIIIVPPEKIQELFAERPGIFKDIQTYTACYLLAFTGARVGELLAMQWGDLDDGVWKLRHAWTNNGQELGKPKWGKVRDVPLPASCLQVLDEYKEFCAYSSSVSWVFGYKDGLPKKYTWIRKRWQDIAEASDKLNSKTRLHDLRRSLNTNLLLANANPIQVQIFLGWSNKMLTPVQEQYYTRIKGENLREIAEVIDRMYAPEMTG